MPLHIRQFRSSLTPWEVFQNIEREYQVCFFLDSHHDTPPDPTYSYIGFSPESEVSLSNHLLHLEGANKKKYLAREIFSCLRSLLNQKKDKGRPFFTGGLAGYLGYEAAEFCDPVCVRGGKKTEIPTAYFGLFRDVIVFDHKKCVYHLVTHGRRPEDTRRNIEKMKRFFRNRIFTTTGFRVRKIRAEMSRGQFKKMVQRAKAYIGAGDIYQANLSQRFCFDFSGSAVSLYGKLRAINPSPFSSFFKIRDLRIVSASPERLIRKRGRHCETRPIAGTCKAYGAERKFREWRKKLLLNPKERAEHLMLVDLERNDLGRVCDYRSVKVKDFMTLEKYSHVVHLVSRITGRLMKEKDAFDLIKAMFPGGTITGCPKIRCREIIEELEPVPRGIYTGSLGYIGFYGEMDLNLVIRTIVLKGNRGNLQVGAGIVWDSNPEKEYEETLHKAKALMQALKNSEGVGSLWPKNAKCRVPSNR